MTIQEMHIEINLSLQKIASNVKRKFYPEEIDWLITKQIRRFIESKIKRNEHNEGFQYDGLDLNAIRTLLVYDFPLSVFKTATANKFVQSELPGDYSYLIENRSGVVRSCNDTYTVVNAFTSKQLFVYKLKIPTSVKANKPFYLNTSLSIGGVIVVPTTKFPTDLQDRDMKFTIESTLFSELYELENLSVKVYWEQFRNNYQSETFIFVSETALAGGVVFTSDGVATAATVSQINVYQPGSSSSIYVKANRELKGNKKSEFQDSAFAKGIWRSPIANLEGNTLKVYHDETFIVNNLNIDYIRKPQQVSLSLGKGCDLPEEFHQAICDKTVEYIKMAMGDPNYQWKLQDNQLNKV